MDTNTLIRSIILMIAVSATFMFLWINIERWNDRSGIAFMSIFFIMAVTSYMALFNNYRQEADIVRETINESRIAEMEHFLCPECLTRLYVEIEKKENVLDMISFHR